MARLEYFFSALVKWCCEVADCVGQFLLIIVCNGFCIKSVEGSSSRLAFTKFNISMVLTSFLARL